SIFGGNFSENKLIVYTHEVTNGNGKKLGIQSLPNSDLETMVIPVGIIAEANKEITFSANVTNLPDGLKVFLEDRNTNTFTRLDELNSKYKVTLTEAANEIGRFYLHTKSSALSTETVALENVSIYNADKSTLRIVGLSQGKSTIKMFNVLGKQVMNATFNSNGVSEINVSQLSTGVYIVQLENEAGSLNKKIVLE
ncbi:MAG: T9SS type A sorting domain-containing protein, partial [Flavobacteriales bacterium]